MNQKQKRQGPGKPPLSDVEKTVRVNVTMTEAQRDKFHALGGSEWARQKIDEAPIPLKKGE